MYQWVLDTNVFSLMFKHQLTEPFRRAMIGQPLGVTYGLQLVTLDKHDFADFAEFEGLELIS